MGRRRTILATVTAATAMTATVLLAGSPAGAVAGYPYCAAGAASDPDGDGWGWEDAASCVVRGSAADTGPAGGGSGACPSGAACGSYSVAGLGGRKQQVLAAGGNDLDLAIAMLETEHLQSDYAYGDNKTEDAANFGIFKQNWLMIRSACGQFVGRSPGRYGDGAVLNGDLGQDVSCLHQSQGHFGMDAWIAGHRNGMSGLGNPGTPDIAAYRAAVYWIRDQVAANPAHRGDDTRFWVDVPAI